VAYTQQEAALSGLSTVFAIPPRATRILPLREEQHFASVDAKNDLGSQLRWLPRSFFAIGSDKEISSQ
jgi:hypothetical protein